jgi:predicted RND superfamily exporter protein
MKHQLKINTDTSSGFSHTLASKFPIPTNFGNPQTIFATVSAFATTAHYS